MPIIRIDTQVDLLGDKSADNLVEIRKSGLYMPSVAPIPVSSLVTGLVDYWRLGNVLMGGSPVTSLPSALPSGKKLVVTNGASLNISNQGIFGGAADFDPNSIFLTSPNSAVPDHWTISLWVKVQTPNVVINPDDSTYPSFFDFGYSDAVNRLVLVAGDRSDTAWWIYDAFTAANYGQFYPATLGQWYHHCIIQSESGLYWYINNNLYITDNGNSVARPMSGLAIGAQAPPQADYPQYYGNNGDYLIDEFGVWNRPLTTEEVSLLYSSGNANVYPFNGTAGANFS